MFTLQQLQYVLALEAEGTFVGAAELCGVTQPTLSMQVQKLESELGITLFDRGRQPIKPTPEGKALLDHARVINDAAGQFQEMVAELIGKIGGRFRLGVIPTIAPYLIPLMVQPFLAKYPEVELTISEHYTADILPMLELGRLDAALIATHEDAPWMDSLHLFDDAFVAYVSPSSELYRKTTLTVQDLEQERLWLLQDGHCLKGQVLQLCRLDRQQDGPQVKYEAGSLDTLQRMVDRYGGATLLPSLAVASMASPQLKRLRYFRDPEPSRPIILASRKNSGRERLKEALVEMIKDIRSAG